MNNKDLVLLKVILILVVIFTACYVLDLNCILYEECNKENTANKFMVLGVGSLIYIWLNRFISYNEYLRRK